MRPDPPAEVLCGLLAEPDRLAVFAAVVLGATDAAEVTEATGLAARKVVTALRRLVEGGLVTADDGALRAETGTFKQAVRANRPDPEPPLDEDRARAAVLRAFIRNGTLVQIPMVRAKRRVVLEHIVASFEPGVKYPEREVDAVLRAWHPDYVSLRRYLVDEELLDREAGTYWRIGGPLDMS